MNANSHVSYDAAIRLARVAGLARRVGKRKKANASRCIIEDEMWGA
jgi:hypothetical protein